VTMVIYVTVPFAMEVTQLNAHRVTKNFIYCAYRLILVILIMPLGMSVICA
jgi:hypothetical protein